MVECWSRGCPENYQKPEDVIGENVATTTPAGPDGAYSKLSDPAPDFVTYVTRFNASQTIVRPPGIAVMFPFAS